MNIIGIVWRGVAVVLSVMGGIGLWGARELSEVAGACRQRSVELPRIAAQFVSTTGWPRHEVPAKALKSEDRVTALLRRIQEPYPDRERAVEAIRQEGSLYGAVATRLDQWVRLMLAIGIVALASAAALIGIAATRVARPGNAAPK
jgi:hypothetical protein